MAQRTGLLTHTLFLERKPDRTAYPDRLPEGLTLSGVLASRSCTSKYQTHKSVLTVAGQWRTFTAFPNIPMRLR
jgi:hypothetical protein